MKNPKNQSRKNLYVSQEDLKEVWIPFEYFVGRGNVSPTIIDLIRDYLKYRKVAKPNWPNELRRIANAMEQDDYAEKEFEVEKWSE